MWSVGQIQSREGNELYSFVHRPVNRIPLHGRVNDLNESRIEYRKKRQSLEAISLVGVAFDRNNNY